MKKIMFNNEYGLTQAVIEGRKTMTRRVIKLKDYDIEYLDTAFDWDLRESVIIDRYAQYKVGEIVAIAQSYKNLGYTKEWVERHISPNPNAKPTDPFEKKYPGWNNKMFVRADLMPHQIRITNIRVERLQDISYEDCLKEGVVRRKEKHPRQEWDPEYTFGDGKYHAQNPRAAFAALIDKVTGKGTWKKNPFVFAYSFELIR